MSNPHLLLDELLNKELFDFIFFREGEKDIDTTYRIYEKSFRTSEREFNDEERERLSTLGFIYVYMENEGESNVYRAIMSDIDYNEIQCVWQTSNENRE